MNLYLYPYHLEFTHCDNCTFWLHSYELFTCGDYCIFSNACLSALEMGWY